jgi:hypothetical protein
MSAYASLPGSFLPPFFSYGASNSSSSTLEKKAGTGTEQKSESKSECADTLSVPPNSLEHNISASQFNTNFDPKKCCTPNSLDTAAHGEARAALQLKAPPPAPTTISSRPSDTIIAIRSARVDPVALIKSLTSTGSSIARRTASFIVRTPDVVDRGCSDTLELASSGTSMEGEEGVDTHTDKDCDRSSVISRPGLCYEDSDSDEEFSMYDYSDDFSSPNDDENKRECCLHNEDDLVPGTSSSGDPSAIEFELSITFQGRKYNATRGFPTFVKLREDLLHELKNNDLRSRRSFGGTKSSIDCMDVESTKKDAGAVRKDDNKLANESLSVPELPRVSPESLGHGGSYALCGVARSGFALLQATAQHYCPEMERWMRHVIEAFPCSQSLSSFLWEPLSSSSASWETIGEGKQSKSQTVKLGPLHDASSGPAFPKPPLHTRTKQKSHNISKSLRYKAMGSVGSLNSIEEDDGNES